MGLTLRGADSTYEGPQTGPFYSGPDDSDFRYNLTTLFAEHQINDIWSSKLTLGIFDQESDLSVERPLHLSELLVIILLIQVLSHQPFPMLMIESLTKYGAYWDNTIKWNSQHTTIAGLVYEKSDYLFTDSFGVMIIANANKKASTRITSGMSPTNWNVSGGLRWEDYSDDGSNGFNDGVFTWRLASAYSLDKTDTTFRGSLGHGFRIPNLK